MMKNILLFIFMFLAINIFSLLIAQNRIPIENENWKLFTPANNKIYSIAFDGDTVWAGSDVGFFKLIPNSGESINFNKINSPLTDNWIMGIEVDANHNKWVGTYEKGIFMINGDNWKIFDPEYFELYRMDIRSMTIENDTLWISTWGDGLIKFNVVDHSFKIYTSENSGLIYDAVFKVVADNKSKKWISTMLGVCTLENDTWTSITEDSAKDEREIIVSVSVDEAGKLWALNNKPAIACFKEGEWKEYEIPTYLFEFGICHAENIYAGKNDRILVISTDGLIQFDNGTWTKVNFYEDSRGLDIVKTIRYDKENNLWVGSWDGLFSFDGTNWEQHPTGNSTIQDDFIQSIVADKRNKIWITSTGGLSCYSNGIWDKYDKSNSALNRNYLTDLVVDSSNNKWIVQLNNGLAMFNDETKIWRTYDTLNSPLPDNGVRCLAVDKEGLLWIGSRKGLSSFDGTNWQNYTTENSNLPNPGVSKIAVDNNNDLWFISSGLDLKNRGDKFVKFDGKEFTVIDIAKDFPKLENKSFYAIWVDDLDRKWVSACDELLWFENEKWNVMDRYATQIFFSCIEEIKSDGKDIVICSSMGGMIRYNGNKFMVQNKDNSFLPNDISTFALDKLGNKWIGTQSKGVILHNPIGIQYENKKK